MVQAGTVVASLVLFALLSIPAGIGITAARTFFVWLLAWPLAAVLERRGCSHTTTGLGSVIVSGVVWLIIFGLALQADVNDLHGTIRNWLAIAFGTLFLVLVKVYQMRR